MHFEWFLNSNPIYDMDGIMIGRFGKKNSILNIDSVQAEHSGKYTCKATNIVGSAYYTTKLAVKGDRLIQK